MSENNKCEGRNVVNANIFICCDVRKSECKYAEPIKQGAICIVICNIRKCEKEENEIQRNCR